MRAMAPNPYNINCIVTAAWQLSAESESSMDKMDVAGGGSTHWPEICITLMSSSTGTQSTEPAKTNRTIPTTTTPFRIEFYTPDLNINHERLPDTIHFRAVGMPLVQSLKDNFAAITHCKWKGHTVSPETLIRLANGNRDETNATCVRCGWPVIARKDPDRPDYWLISED